MLLEKENYNSMTSDTTPASNVKPVVLLVEDYEPNILVASIYLENLGYAFEVAHRGTQAIEKVKEKSYSVILMDVQMPDINGFDTTKRIREFETANNRKLTPIIGVTAYAFVGDRERCIAAGMDDYISKPIKGRNALQQIEILHTF